MDVERTAVEDLGETGSHLQKAHRCQWDTVTAEEESSAAPAVARVLLNFDATSEAVFFQK